MTALDESCQPVVDPDATAEHLAQLFRGCRGQVAVSRIVGGGWRTQTYGPGGLQKAAVDAAGWSAQGFEVYVRMTTLNKSLPANRRGSDADSLELTSLSLDIDGRWGVHKADAATLPATVEEALTVLADFPPPTRVVSSGGGLYPLWLLEDPIPAKDAKPILARWDAFWQERFKQVGWHLDPTADLSRVLRPPGLLNFKDRVAPRPVALLDIEGPRWDLEDLVRLLPELEERHYDPQLGAEWSPDPFDMLRRLGSEGHRLVAEHLLHPDRGDWRWTLAPDSAGGAVERCGWSEVNLIRPPGSHGPASSARSARIGGRSSDGKDYTGWAEVFSGDVDGVPSGSHQIGMFLAYAAFDGDRYACKRWLAARGVGRLEDPGQRDKEAFAQIFRAPVVGDDGDPGPQPPPDLDGDDAPPEALSTWLPIDLAPVLEGIATGTITRPAPTVGVRDDGIGLFYRGRVNGVYGGPGTGKSMLAQHVAAEELLAGRHVLYIDLEDHEDAVCGRLLQMGVPEHVILDQFHYITPQGAINRLDQALLENLIASTRASVAVIDSTGEGITLQGLKDDDNGVTIWFNVLPRRIARQGPAVILIDHVIKDEERRGLWAAGSQRKLSAIDGAAFMVDKIKSFGIGLAGLSKLTTAKDRNGTHANSHAAGLFAMDNTSVTQLTGNLTAPVTAPGGKDDDMFRPTGLMERVSRWLELNPTASKNAIETNVEGKVTFLRKALAALVTEEYVTVEKQGQALVHTVAKKYRQAEDPLDERGNQRTPNA